MGEKQMNLKVIFSNKESIKYQDKIFSVISRNDLIEAKREAGRPKDLADVDELLKISEINKTQLEE